ncbi:hypothetical protein ACUSIJ_06905 [Pseudochelatococcus sp. B33]
MSFRALPLAGALSGAVLATGAHAADLIIGFSQIGSESGWRAAETNVSKAEAKEAEIPVVLLDRDIDPSGKDLCLTAVTSGSVHEGRVAGVPDIFKAVAAGEANATVELTPNMAGPAFDALIAYKTEGTVPPKWIQTESKLYTAADNPRAVYESKKDLGY